jgi:segregation and condensation protein B
MTLKQVIEALVFASPKPLLTKEILAALRSAGEGSEDLDAQSYATFKEAEVLAALAEVEAELISSGRSFHLVERVNGWTLVSDPLCAVWVRQLYPEAKPTRLTGPQLETLAIIAYRQPVTRADCEAVRGVAVDGVMQILLDRGLVKIAGRAEVPGRPLLYSTTEYFLQHFGLKTTDELPNAGELKRVVLPTAKVEEPAAAPADGTAPAEPAAPDAAAPAEKAEAPEAPVETEAAETPSEPEPAPEEEAPPAAEAEENPSPDSEDRPSA